MNKLFEGVDDESAEGVSNTQSELLDCGYGRCWGIMTESVEFLTMVWIV